VHGGAWRYMGIKNMGDARGAHGGPAINGAQMCGGVRSYQVRARRRIGLGYVGACPLEQ